MKSPLRIMLYPRWLFFRSSHHRSPDSGNGSAGHAGSDPAALMDSLGAESLPEQERRLSEAIAELQKLREHITAQRGSTNGSSSSTGGNSDYSERVSHHFFRLFFIFNVYRKQQCVKQKHSVSQTTKSGTPQSFEFRTRYSR